MTVVCATDFSEAASEAMEIAAAIATKRGEPLLLWHAVEPEFGDVGDPNLEPLRVESVMRLDAEAERIRQSGLTVDTQVVIGWPDPDLPATMPANTTLLVAGARGHSRDTHWLIGSVTERLARVATVPLLVVRETVTLRNWLHGVRKLNVVLATDLSPVSDHALRRAGLLKELGPCNVELLYVEYPPLETARLGARWPPSGTMERTDALSEALHKRAVMADLGGNVSARVAVTTGSLAVRISGEAEEANADLVVVGTHQRKALSRLWTGSVAHGVLHSALTNVLCIPFHSGDEAQRALEPPEVSTIVAATDFSSCGNRAVAWAAATAPPGTQIVVTTVVSDEEAKDAAARELEAIAAAPWPDRDVRMVTEVNIGGDIAAAICAAADRHDADLIVLGRHARSVLQWIFPRSVAGEVLFRSRRPVLLVPDEAMI